MEFKTHSYLNGDAVIKSNPGISALWSEFEESLNEVSDEELIAHFEGAKRKAKSISDAINKTFEKKLVARKWKRQSRIFKDRDTYKGTTWTLDFSKQSQVISGATTGVAVEVVFNHGEAIAWNLIKLSMAAENNYVRKETDIGEGIGIYVCATAQMKKLGGFDGAVGEYEKVLKYLDPLNSKIIRPMIIVGLLPPKTFEIEHYPNPKDKDKVLGRVIRY
jgi:hypothetical protein